MFFPPGNCWKLQFQLSIVDNSLEHILVQFEMIDEIK